LAALVVCVSFAAGAAFLAAGFFAGFFVVVIDCKLAPKVLE
jgi:hypothetical protein